MIDPFKIQDSGKMTHIMQKNGMLYDDYPRAMSTCLHENSEHLDLREICLVPECLCLEFVVPGQLTIIPKKIEKAQAEVSNYIQVLSRI